MLRSLLSSRRAIPSSITSTDPAKSKSKKTHGPIAARILRKIQYRTAQIHRSCSLPVALLTVVMILGVVVFARHWIGSRACGEKPYDVVGSRMRLFVGRVEGLASDFGVLGVPWCRSKDGKTVDWGSKDLIEGLEEFVPIYETRPIKNNTNGMGFDHSFGLWFMARWLKPVLMIESEAFRGHSTWILRQALPETPIISISRHHPEDYLEGPAYVDGNCTYITGKDFVDFGSINWRNLLEKHGVSNINQVLIFFDDHQNQLKRLKQALKFGFQHLIFEHSYDTGIGNHYSLRQICDQFYVGGGGHSCFADGDEARIRRKRRKMWDNAVDIDELCAAGESWWGVRGEMRDEFNRSNRAISHADHFRNGRYVESFLDAYWELPPVAGPSLTHQARYDPARTTSPIVEDGQYSLFRRLGLSRLDRDVFNGYEYMVYAKISAPEL